jgi:alanine-glyoxylate transaminase / serine-glyoxylate transaminase / serine-pyruvate transaminase
MTYRSGRHSLWAALAGRFGLDVDVVPGDWRQGVQADQVGEKLAADPEHRIKAVTVVQNETSTGCASQIPLIRAAMDRAGHPALLIVDTISSLGSVEYRQCPTGTTPTRCAG